MAFSDLLQRFNPKARKARKANEELQANAHKALQMKKAAGAQTNIPEHQTSHDGAIHGAQIGYTDTALGKEGTYTENTGRSRGARASDAS